MKRFTFKSQDKEGHCEAFLSLSLTSQYNVDLLGGGICFDLPLFVRNFSTVDQL